MARSVTVKVPATSANMGPGFDCLGIALDIWNTVRVETDVTGFEIDGLGRDDLPTGPGNLVARSFRLVFEVAGEQIPDVRFTCTNEIPLGRGLGSSSAAAVGGIVAANELLGRPLAKDDILALAARIEGHPDNSAAASYGGCQIVVRDSERLITAAVSVPEGLYAVLFVPEVPMPTIEARSVIPTEISVQDAVFNMGRVGLLVNAFATGDFTYLAIATQDRIHQPPRQNIFRPMKVIIRAALEAGALGAFLSGAGSSILAFTNGREMTVGYEMAEAASKAGIEGDVIVTKPTSKGAHVV